MSDGDLLSYEADIPDRRTFARFLIALADDLRYHPDDWARADLEEYLRVMAGWMMNGFDAFHVNMRNKPAPNNPDWRLFADIMSAARIIED